MKKKLARAFSLLNQIPVVGNQVDAMHEIRLLLSDVYNSIPEEKEEKGDKNG